jgi:hypothetical protein
MGNAARGNGQRRTRGLASPQAAFSGAFWGDFRLCNPHKVPNLSFFSKNLAGMGNYR